MGQVARYDPDKALWHEWKVPGSSPGIYAIYLDDEDIVWLTDFNGNALVRFNPRDNTFTSVRSEFQLSSDKAIRGVQ